MRCHAGDTELPVGPGLPGSHTLDLCPAPCSLPEQGSACAATWWPHWELLQKGAGASQTKVTFCHCSWEPAQVVSSLRSSSTQCKSSPHGEEAACMGRLLDQPTEHTFSKGHGWPGGRDAGKASSTAHGAPKKEGVTFKKVSSGEGCADGSTACGPWV